MRNVFQQVPSEVRAGIYIAYALAGLILGSFQVGFGSASSSAPEWVTVALAVYAYVGGVLGIAANANTDVGGVPESQFDAEDLVVPTDPEAFHEDDGK